MFIAPLFVILADNTCAKTKIKRKDQINLFLKRSVCYHRRILLWLLSTFRFIVIITELFVVAAFISRFWLDVKNTDLSEKIQNDKLVIESFRDFEKEFKNIQEKLNIYTIYAKDQGLITETVKSIVSNKPSEVTFSSITASESEIKVGAKSVSELGIQQFLVNLKANDKFEGVRLGDVTSSEEGSAFSFNVIITYNKT
jgi:hypothetical protein